MLSVYLPLYTHTQDLLLIHTCECAYAYSKYTHVSVNHTGFFPLCLDKVFLLLTYKVSLLLIAMFLTLIWF